MSVRRAELILGTDTVFEALAHRPTKDGARDVLLAMVPPEPAGAEEEQRQGWVRTRRKAKKQEALLQRCWRDGQPMIFRAMTAQPFRAGPSTPHHASTNSFGPSSDSGFLLCKQKRTRTRRSYPQSSLAKSFKCWRTMTLVSVRAG